MSYDLAVWDGEHPADDQAAGRTFEGLTERYGESNEPPTDQIRAYVESLLSRYPDTGSASPWSTSDLVAEAVGPLLHVPIVYSRCEEISAWAAEIAVQYGLVCYDPQLDRLLSVPAYPRHRSSGPRRPSGRPADVDTQSWLRMVKGLWPASRVGDPLSSRELGAAGKRLGVRVPSPVGAVLRACNGVWDEHAGDVLWPLDRMVEMNLGLWEAEVPPGRQPVDSLLILGQSVTGEVFAFQWEPRVYIRWDRATDARWSYADTMENYLRRRHRDTIA